MDDTQKWTLTSVVIYPFENHPEDLTGMKVFIDGIELNSSVAKNNSCTSIETKPYDVEECNGQDGFTAQKVTITTS